MMQNDIQSRGHGFFLNLVLKKTFSKRLIYHANIFLFQSLTKLLVN